VDPFSHALWSVIIFRKLKIQMFWVMFFSVFPDILSSVPFLIWRIVYFTVLNNHFSLDIILREWTEQIPPNIFALFDTVYNLSHSIFLFGTVLILLFILKRQKMNGKKLRSQLREMAFTPIWAWGLHLALDLISHAGPEHAERFFYPFSNFYFGLTNWFTLPFMIINTATLTAAGIIILVSKSKKKSW
jgi:hypothetical protein